MLLATNPTLADGLLLLSYPLHPPRKPEQLRTQHFPKLQRRALFVHGSRDGFGSLQELESALKLIPVDTRLLPVPGFLFRNSFLDIFDPFSGVLVFVRLLF